MIVLKYILVPIWRIWFYTWTCVVILILSPLVILTTLRDEDYPKFFSIARFWAWTVLVGIGFFPKVSDRSKIIRGQQYIYCPNHVSIIDIMLILITATSPFKFIGKKELSKIPVFGYFYKRTNILVDRSNPRSRQNSLKMGSETLGKGIGLCIFPEGGVPEEEWLLGPFKRGAFKLSKEYNISIVPLTFADNKRKFPFDFFRGYPGIVRAIVHNPISPDEGTQEELSEKVYHCISDTLKSLGQEGKTV